MPQTLTDEWREHIGSGCDAVYDKWLHTLGNLTLTGYNSELSNDSFDDKKAKLQNTHFELTRGFLAQESWGAKEIEERGKQMAQLAVHRWSRE
jgi:hypothetical protein